MKNYIELRQVVNGIINGIETFAMNKDYSNAEANTEYYKKIDELINYVNDINIIEKEAILNGDHELMFNCENLKGKVINVLEYIKVPYTFTI